MPDRSKRSHDDIIDLTADSSDVERDQPQRKAARLPLPVHRPSQIFNRTWVQDDEDGDADDIIDLTQEVDNNGIGFVEIGRIGTSFSISHDYGRPECNWSYIDDKIVGIRYYNGHASAGESVIIRREPTNPVR